MGWIRNAKREAREGIEDRGLSPKRRWIWGSTARVAARWQIAPDIDGNILCWPYFELDVEVNTKYRWAQDGIRMSQQKKGAVKTVFNANVLPGREQPARLETGWKSLIWTEGEFDCQAALESGYYSVISVPDGAPCPRQERQADPVPDDDRDIDPEDRRQVRVHARLINQLMRVKTHIIATDGDEPGARLAGAGQKLGAAKCF